jgi:hypothetical protein
VSDLDTLGQDFGAELAKLITYYDGTVPAYRNISAQKGSTAKNLRVVSIAGAEGLFKPDILPAQLALQDVTLPAGYTCGVTRTGPLIDPVSYYAPPLSNASFKTFKPGIKFVVMHSFGRAYDYSRVRRTRTKSASTESATFNTTDPATAYNATRFASGLLTYVTPSAPAQIGMHHLVSLRGDLVNSASWDSACTHVISTGTKNNLPTINEKSIGINHEEWYYDNAGTGELRSVEDQGPYSEQQYVLDAFLLKKLEAYTGDKFTHYLGHGPELKANVANNTPGCFAHASGSNSLDPGGEFFLPPDFRLGISSVSTVPIIKALYGTNTAAWDRRFEIWYKNAARGEYISAYARIFAKVERLRSFDITTELFDPKLKTLALNVKVPAIKGSGALSVAEIVSQNKLLSVIRAQQSQYIPRKDLYDAAQGTANTSSAAWARNTARLVSITKKTSSAPATITNAMYMDPNTGEWERADSTNPVEVVTANPPLSGGTTVSTSPRGVYDYGLPDRYDAALNGMPVSRNPYLLIPSFAERLQDLFNSMRAAGYDPVFSEGFRTSARAQLLNERGTGVPDSMHEYGAAVDIDSKKDGFSNDKFYIALGEHSQRLGLTWGGTFSADRRHVQAVSIKDQPVLRSLLPNELDKFVQQRLAGGVRATL